MCEYLFSLQLLASIGIVSSSEIFRIAMVNTSDMVIYVFPTFLSFSSHLQLILGNDALNESVDQVTGKVSPTCGTPRSNLLITKSTIVSSTKS